METKEVLEVPQELTRASTHCEVVVVAGQALAHVAAAAPANGEPDKDQE